MRKYTQKELRTLVAEGYATDVTHATNDTRKAIMAAEGFYTQIGYSAGVYGCNGMLFEGHKSGTLYAVTKRAQAIYVL